jgi:hypothetical protein
MHIKDSTCQNIFFGASGSPQYMHLLQKHGAFSEKITLIQRGSEDSSITKLGLRTVTLAQTFESLASTEAISENTEQTFSSFKVNNLSTCSLQYIENSSNIKTERTVRRIYRSDVFCRYKPSSKNLYDSSQIVEHASSSHNSPS